MQETVVTAPSAAEVSRALSLIFASPEFMRAPVMRHLLNFLVSETLSGRGDRLKAYSVAVDALGRSPDFDAQSDSYPRVQVGRLRKMLATYYADAPRTTLRLDIPRGGYRVDFVREEQAAEPAAHALPQAFPSRRSRLGRRLATAAAGVLAFAGAVVIGTQIDDGNAAASAPGAIVAAPTIAIEPGDTATTRRGRVRLAEMARALATPLSRSWLTTVVTGAAGIDSRYALLVDLDAAERNGSLRLIDRRDGTLLWSDTVALPADNATLAAALRPQVSTLVRPTGVIAAHQRRELGDSFAPGAPCLLQYDRYFRERDPAIAGAVSRCIAGTVRRAPGNGPALAAASFLLLDPASGGGPANLARANAFATQAARVAPQSTSAFIAAGRVASIAGNCVRTRSETRRAEALDDSNPEVLALAGMLLIDCDPPRAHALLTLAAELDPDLTTFFVPALIMLNLDDGDRAAAVAHAQAMRTPAVGMRAQYLIGQTLGAIAVDDRAAAARAWAAVVDRARPSDRTTDQVLARYYYMPAFRERLRRRLEAAGLTMPPAAA